VLLVLAGLAGVLIERAWSESAGKPIPAKGGFWQILSRTGRVKQVSPPSAGIRILPGEKFRLDGVHSSVTTIDSFSIRVRRDGRQSGYVRMNFRDQGSETYRLVVVPGESVLGTLSYAPQGSPPEQLAEQRRPGLMAGADEAYELTLRFDGPRFVVEINGQELLRARDDRIPNGHVVVWGDDVRLLSAGVKGSKLTADNSPERFEHSDDLRAFRGRPASLAARLLPAVGWALALLLAAAAYLRHLCLGAPPASLLWRATFAVLAPASALLALRPLLTVPFEPLLLVLAGSLGLMFALYVLRDHVRAIVPSGPQGSLRILLVIAVLGGMAAWVHGRARTDAMRPAIAAAERARARVTGGAFELDAPMRLDPTNALTVSGSYRSLELDTEVTLEPDSLLEVRLHAEPGLPNGVTLFLSTDARWPSSFYLATKGGFGPLGESFGLLEAGRAHEVGLRVAGDLYEVTLDGRRAGSVRMRAFPSGSVVVLAARGEASLSRLAIEPIVPEPPVRDASGEARAAGAVPWTLMLLLALSAVVLLIVPIGRALEAAAWMTVPIALGVHGWAEPNGRMALVTFGITLLAFISFALPWTLLHSHRSGPLRTAAFLLLAVLLGTAALDRTNGPPIVNDEQKGIAWDEFDLPRIEPGLSFLQHPYIRRFNSYVIDHTFRGRTFDLAPAPGAVRVISLGTSSTWGHGIEESTGLDYPTVLEGLLSERMPGQAVEVINGAVRGSTVARLLRIFRESLLAFQPDIVTLSVYYNDSVYLTQVDEEAYLTRISEPGYEHGRKERFGEFMQRKRSQRIEDHIWQQMKSERGDSIGSWNEIVTDPAVSSPPERFEAGIRALAELARERGFELVLIQEPIRGNVARIWRDEFRAVMDRLGEEYGLHVVDPAPALADGGGRKLFMDEVHPLPDGHRVMAEVLAPVIERLIQERNANR